ncbi:MAG: 16S rRNA (guanine(966)-N(2))-methyltransferase RsmD [Cyanobacteria bacterium]|nr:16S rRNA (guanine(966)-N(2))-methyltransferase RsmD [Cyanobacteriota bacterium]MDW8202501.1 16S rRNA (guanine(966)-N(2))-methyltransferase RsmD [Cyanobacteriota bacterium SKYGB_h_bin112]
MSIRVYGNRSLKTRPGTLTRPTSAKVRAALFNIWQGRIEGCRWLDLCAGSGAMGAEALGRGAAIVVGIEQDSRACAVIRQNWQQMATATQQFKVLQGNVLKRLPNIAGDTGIDQFDCIYLDPPYASDLYEAVLKTIVDHNLLAPDAEVAAEHAIADADRIAALAPQLGLTLSRQKHYGETTVSFFGL